MSCNNNWILILLIIVLFSDMNCGGNGISPAGNCGGCGCGC